MSLRPRRRAVLWIGACAVVAPFVYAAFSVDDWARLDALVAIYGAGLSVLLGIMWGGLILTMRNPDSYSAAVTFAAGAWLANLAAACSLALFGDVLIPAVSYVIVAFGALVVQRLLE